MDWRKLERELIDILKTQDVDLTSEAGDTILIDDKGGILFSISDLAKQLALRLS